jgi:hypothetical protein
LLALASTVAIGAAMLIAAQPAQAMSAIDGQWTVSHGGTGLVTLNADGTYTSTCVVYPNYDDAWCPSPAGTFRYSTASVASVTFSGSDGSSHSYRVSGLVSSPDTITSVFGSRTYSPLVMKRGTEFVCTDWVGTGTSFTRWGLSPEVEYDATSDLLYATGSHDLIGPNNIDTQVHLAETASNYFQNGSCDAFEPAPTPTTSTSAPTTTTAPAPTALHIGDLDDATLPSSNGSWQPTVTAAVLDSTGTAVAGATVSGTFAHHSGTLTCVTTTDGACTLGDFSFSKSIKSTEFQVTGVSASASTYAPSANSDPDGDSTGTAMTVTRP